LVGDKSILTLGSAAMVEAVRCRVYGPLAYFYLGILSIMSFVGVPLLISASVGSAGPPLWFSALWIAGISWNWFIVLWLFAYEVRLSVHGVLTFRCVLREVRVHGRDLVSVAPLRWDLNGTVLVFRTPSDKMRTLRNMDGLFALMGQLRLINPAIQTRGL
jgi:hypothetical protein